jgi:glycosyltransferase involved in cell wall biosynthesis
MKIVLFVYRYWPDVGGVEKYIHRLAKALVENHHDVRIVVPAHRPGLPSHERHDGIEVYRFPGYRSPLRAWWHLLRLRGLFRWADVIHVSNTHVLEYFYRMVAWWLPHKRLFLTRHGMSYTFPVPEQEKARARRSRELVDGVIHDGCFIGRWLEVVPDAVPDQGLYPEAQDLPVAFEPPPKTATFVGRLDPDSGIEIYIDTIAVLRDRYNLPISLNVYGGGTLEADLRERVKRLELSVVFHGWQPDAQEHIADGCFAFVAGRMAMQEAMARRRLVVAAYVDPLKRDYVEGEPFSPYLVSGEDAETVAERVAHYATHEAERRALVERAYAHSRTLTWRRTAKEYERIWTQPPRPRAPMAFMSRLRLAWQLRREAYDPEQRPGASEPEGRLARLFHESFRRQSQVYR